MKKYVYNLTICSLLMAGMSGCNDDINFDDVKYHDYIKQDVAEYEGYTLEWVDEFDKDGLPSANSWGYEEGYRRNSEWQDYKKESLEHSFVKDGSLFIKATVDPHDGVNPWTNEPYHFGYSSASVTTKDKMSFQYGRIDIAMEVPYNISVWPQLWMEPVDNKYGTEATIKIMEYVWGADKTHNVVQGSLHTQNTVDGVTEPLEGTHEFSSLEGRFHLYSLIWNRKEIEILCDNESILKYEKTEKMDENDWPFDQPFCLYMSLAVGGTKGGTQGVDESIFPQEMEIKYVRYYKLIDDGEDEDSGDEEGGDEGDGDGDGGEEIPEPINLVVNGNFDQPFGEGKEPAIIKDGDMSGDKFYSYFDCWSAKQGKSIGVKSENGNRFLVYNNVIANWWDPWIRYPIQNVDLGKYTFSFKIKNSKEEASFAACIAYCETSDDFKFYDEGTKKTDIIVNAACIYVNEKGEQSLISKNDGKPLYPVITGTSTNTEWREYSVDVDIPSNSAIILTFAPHLQWNNGSYKALTGGGNNTTPLDYYIDDVSLVKKEETPAE